MPLKILEGIRQFLNQVHNQQDIFESLGKGQWPEVLFITCSDSRLSPHAFTNSGLGELFIGRNPGNIVPPYPDTSMPSGEAATIEFALTHLNIKEIIVCGHSDCGAMKGLQDPDLKTKLPYSAAWLGHSALLLEDIEKRHPDIIRDPSLRLRHLTEDNILLQIEHLKTHPAVAKRLDNHTLMIHGWYYEINTGKVYIFNSQKKSFISFEQTVEDIAVEKLADVVEQEARAYLMSLSVPKSRDEYEFLVKTYNHVRFMGVGSIWGQIEKKVKEELHHQIGRLYITDTGNSNPDFEALLKKGPSIRLHSLEYLSTAIKESSFHLALKTKGNGMFDLRNVGVFFSEYPKLPLMKSKL